MSKRKRSRRTAFVPTVVFGTTVLGVLPACATGCGDQPGPTKGGSGVDAMADGSGRLTVAQIGFEAGIELGTDAGPATLGDGGADADAGWRLVPLAYMGFDVRYFGERD